MPTKVMRTPEEIASKWGRNTKNAVTDMQDGVNRVTESPMQKAIAKKEKMRLGINRALDDGTWEKRLGKVTTEDWKSKTVKKIGERLPGGVDAAMSKRIAFDAHNTAVLNEVLPKIHAMPDMTIQDSVNRVAALMEHMHNRPYKKV